MEKKKAFRVILLSILISYTVCEVAEDPNHLFTESSTKVTGSRNLSAIHADVSLRSRQHNFSVQISDSFSSDDERIGSLDGKVLPASKNAQKSTLWTIYDKTRNVSTMRKLEFAMRRSVRRHHIVKSSHGTGMRSSASVLENSKEAYTYQRNLPSTITGLTCQTKITAPFNLTILPTEETIIPSVDTADTESDWISKSDNSTQQDDQKSSHINDMKNNSSNSSNHGEPRVIGHEGPTSHAGTSVTPAKHKMYVHPGLKTSSVLRWKAAYDPVKLDDSKKGKHFKTKKKKTHSVNEEQEDSSSWAATVAGILTGILMLLFIFTGVPRLWITFNKQWSRRRSHEQGSNFPSTDEELSEKEIIFDRSEVERNMESSKDACPRTTPEASVRRPQSASPSHQSPDHPKQEQKIWTLTDTPSFMAHPTLDDTNRTEVWTANEIPETKSLDSSSTTSSLSDLSTGKPTEAPPSESLTSTSSMSQSSGTEVCDHDLATTTRSSASSHDMEDKPALSSLPFTTQSSFGPSTSSKETISEYSLSPHPTLSGYFSLPTASEESIQTVSMATTDRSSTESCKTPIAVAARYEAVITKDDEDESTSTSDKSQDEVLTAVKDTGKESCKAEIAVTMRTDDDEESSVIYDSESSTGEVIHASQEAEMKYVTTGDVIIDTLGRDNDNEETSVINETSKDGCAQPSDAVKPQAKREVRWKDETSNSVDTGASTGNNPKIRVLNHKDYKTWKERQKDIKMKKAQGIKPRDVLPGLQAMRDIYNLPRIPVDSEGECRCYYCEKHIKRAQRGKFFKLPSKLFSFKSKSPSNESPSSSESSSPKNSAGKIRVLNHKDYNTWKERQKDIKMKKAQGGIKPRDVLPGLQAMRDIYNLPRIPVDSEGECLCYYCEKHIKRAQRGKFFKLPRFHR